MKKILKGSLVLEPRASELAGPWFDRISALIPLMPSEVAEQWIHRHWCSSPYENLVVSTMGFKKEVWEAGHLSDITGLEGQDPEFYMKNDYLADYMRRRGTWPVPIVVLDNTRPSSEAASLAFGRLQLLEGHRRLAFIRQLAERGESLSHHEVWVASYPLDSLGSPDDWSPRPPPKYVKPIFNPRDVSPITARTPINSIPQEVFDDLTDDEISQLEAASDVGAPALLLERVRLRLIVRSEAGE